MIIFFSNIEIDLYSFYRKNLIATPKIRTKLISQHTRLRESDDLFLSRAKLHRKKPPLCLCARNAVQGNDLKLPSACATVVCNIMVQLYGINISSLCDFDENKMCCTHRVLANSECSQVFRNSLSYKRREQLCQLNGPFVQSLDNASHWISHYPVDKC